MSKKYLIGSMKRNYKRINIMKNQKKLQGCLDKFRFKTSLSAHNRNVCESWLAEIKFDLKTLSVIYKCNI